MDTTQVALLRKTLELISGNPEQWSQGVWAANMSPVQPKTLTVGSCGTVACLAGWAVLLAGHTVDAMAPVVLDVDYQHCGDCCTPSLATVEDVADRELGLPSYHGMFDGNNTLRDLWQGANHYSDGQIEIPAEFA